MVSAYLDAFFVFLVTKKEIVFTPQGFWSFSPIPKVIHISTTLITNIYISIFIKIYMIVVVGDVEMWITWFFHPISSHSNQSLNRF